jgi:hypothetical protein
LGTYRLRISGVADTCMDVFHGYGLISDPLNLFFY